jgi:prepilin-type N-terminal cleavage/methylation domain-containing protein
MTMRSITNPFRDCRRPGFTLVEILIVIGIITLILGIALPVTFTARRKASRMKAVRDIAALQTGLEEYKNVHGEYPQIGLGGTVAGQGQAVLYCALTGLNRNGNIDRDPKSNRPRDAFINLENFRVAVIANLGQISDTNQKPYLYFVATIPAPDIRSNANGGMFVRDYAQGAAGPSLYNHSNCAAITLRNMRVLLGDDSNGTPANPNGNGNIEPNRGENAASVAPYVLWAAGPDAIYGLDTQNPPKTDDVTNFEIPAKYLR